MRKTLNYYKLSFGEAIVGAKKYSVKKFKIRIVYAFRSSKGRAFTIDCMIGAGRLHFMCARGPFC